MALDFEETTPPPDPTPKKVYVWPARQEADGANDIPWTTGQTFQQAIAAALPVAVRQKTLAFDARIRLRIQVEQL